MSPLVAVRSYPQGPRVWIAGQRVHHGASGLLAAAALVVMRRPRAAAVALAWAATDWHDRRSWFAREALPVIAGAILDNAEASV